MAKQLNYNIAFKPNTKELDSALARLQAELNNFGRISFHIDSTEVAAAKTAARDLQKYLNLATNTSTGKLNLGKFATELKSANTSVSDLSHKLLAVGPQGEKVFGSFVKSIASAEGYVKQTNSALNEMMITLKNTLRWQAASTVIGGITSGISDAVSYAHQLDSSLRDIRIVSGESAENMDAFAKKANKAAKELYTTTKEYADASLILYQQGKQVVS